MNREDSYAGRDFHVSHQCAQFDKKPARTIGAMGGTSPHAGELRVA
jgi:hypothetical protein